MPTQVAANSLKSHILEAWKSWEGKASTQEDKDIMQLLHFIEDWDAEYSARLTDFINTDELSITSKELPPDTSWRLMEELPPLPRGSSFRVENYNKKGRKLLCPTALLTFPKGYKKFFLEDFGDEEDFASWLAYIKTRTEAVLGKKLAWAVNYRGK